MHSNYIWRLVIFSHILNSSIFQPQEVIEVDYFLWMKDWRVEYHVRKCVLTWYSTLQSFIHKKKSTSITSCDWKIEDWECVKNDIFQMNLNAKNVKFKDNYAQYLADSMFVCCLLFFRTFYFEVEQRKESIREQRNI